MTPLTRSETEMNHSTSTIIKAVTNPSTSIEIVEIAVETSPSTRMETDNNQEEHTTNIPSSSEQPPREPCRDLINGDPNNYIDICVRLYEASVTGNWETATALLDQRPELVKYAITQDHDTPLHVAASAQETKLTIRFVENLVDRMELEDLEILNKDSNTALWLAAAAGNVNIAKIMVNKNTRLPSIPGKGRTLPLCVGAEYERHDMVNYLYNASKNLTSDGWEKEQRGDFLQKCMECDLFEIARQVVGKYRDLAEDPSVLRILAGKTDALNTVNWSVIKRIINSRTDYALILLKIVLRIHYGPPSRDDNSGEEFRANRDYSSQILFDAAKAGNTRFVIELLRVYPDQICQVNGDDHTIFHIAVMNRHQGIYNLLYEIGSKKDKIIPLIDKDGNNMLHLVGLTSKEMRPHMFEASLVMQRELLWFKAVEKMLPPSRRKRKNKAGQTPYELFSENNRDVVSQGLKWIKTCMVVATLIVTVAFAVAFSVPGGYHQSLGLPIFIHRSTFLVFVIADAICLFSSSASLLLFLSILISRYNHHHFLYSLPKKLMMALSFLFISVVAMMVTFGASFFVIYRKGLEWVAFLISIFVSIPVIIFATLQIPFLADMSRSVCDNRYLFNPRSNMLYNRKWM